MDLVLINMIATFLIGACYIPQIITTYKTKNVEGMSLSFWIMLVMALFCFTLNAVVMGDISYLITQMLNLSLAGVMLVMVMMYKKPIEVEKPIRKVYR